MNNEEFQKIVIEELKSLRTDINVLKSDMNVLKSQTGENTDILKALVHSVEVVKAEQEKMTIDMAHIKGDVKAIRHDLSTVETITASNYCDIVKLKAVGQ